MSANLTDKQRAFIYEYLLDFNATAAAERAGYRGGRQVLAAIGSENLRKEKILHPIWAHLLDRALSAQEVVYRLNRQARGTMADFLSQGPDGRLTLDLEKAAEAGALDLVEHLRIEERQAKDGRIRRRVHLKLYDAQKALQLLGQGYGLWAGKLEQIWQAMQAGEDDQDTFPWFHSPLWSVWCRRHQRIRAEIEIWERERDQHPQGWWPNLEDYQTLSPEEKGEIDPQLWERHKAQRRGALRPSDR